jgi:hypothetical protein
MSTLRWKGWEQGWHYGHWSARASRAVGGEYQIMKAGGTVNCFGLYEEVSYRVEHQEKAHGQRRDLYVRSPIGYRTQARTLAEAMALAQSDNDRILAGLAAHTAPR